MDETTLGGRLREAAGMAGLSVLSWDQVERGDKPVASRHMLEAMARALRVHPTTPTLVSSSAQCGTSSPN